MNLFWSANKSAKSYSKSCLELSFMRAFEMRVVSHLCRFYCARHVSLLRDWEILPDKIWPTLVKGWEAWLLCPPYWSLIELLTILFATSSSKYLQSILPENCPYFSHLGSYVCCMMRKQPRKKIDRWQTASRSPPSRYWRRRGVRGMSLLHSQEHCWRN